MDATVNREMARIVVVEKDHLMQRLLVEWLEAAGYGVRTFPSCKDVSGIAPDLVIADVYMPRHGGCDKLDAVRQRWPATPLIAISGQFCAGSSSASAMASEMGAKRIIAKPFTREILLSAVRDVAG